MPEPEPGKWLAHAACRVTTLPAVGSPLGLSMEETSLAGDPQGRDCSCNPSAFPPSMEVRCGKVEQCRSNCRDAKVERTPHMDMQVPRKAGADSGLGSIYSVFRNRLPMRE